MNKPSYRHLFETVYTYMHFEKSISNKVQSPGVSDWSPCLKYKCIYVLYIYIYTHTHIYINVYIFQAVYMCVCVCVYIHSNDKGLSALSIHFYCLV